MSPMRGDVKERFSLRPLREEMDLATGIQPDLRSGEALCSRRPMRGDVKERFSLRPLREEMDLATGIQPDLRSGEALCSRRVSDRARQSTVFVRWFHDLMVRRLRFGSYASKPGWL